ncbi:MAG: hypothetical protein K0S39_3608 [Paenibacillus sp.]|jgi:hypothetical protein|nr:hypothetical protein [Paenibacillus sp.]
MRGRLTSSIWRNLPIEIMGSFFYNIRIVRAREVVWMAIKDCRNGQSHAKPVLEAILCMGIKIKIAQ